MKSVTIPVCLAVILLSLSGSVAVHSQCILRNPSFEILDSGANVFGGWNQANNCGFSSNATHGSKAARVTGPNYGYWEISCFWQQFDSAPGDRWAASVKGWHSAAKPLTGGSKAIVNIEWRDAGDALISFESFDVATASTPVDSIQEFYDESGGAPSGTVKVRILVAVLHDPSQPPPDVFYDEVAFYNLASPPESFQWNDFPGGRVINFSGRDWRVKGDGYYGPGPNLFRDNADVVWVDAEDRLHLSVKYLSGAWYSTEVVLEEALGYGDYIFTTRGDLDQLDPQVVFGLFLWEYGPCWSDAFLWWNPYNEIDVEFSRWGDPGKGIAQFVAQPYYYSENISRFDPSFGADEVTSHAFRWLHDRVEYRSWRGGPHNESTGPYLHTWTYTGPHIPRPEQPRVHLNLWKLEGTPGSNQEVVLESFAFYPEGIVSGTAEDTPAVSRHAHLFPAWPNPFNPTTTIGYNLPEAGLAEIVIYDVAGRHVRTLVNEHATAGDHDVAWNGRDDSGLPVASGVYLYQLRAGSVVETRKMVLLK